jgi:hypothetical protein
MIITNIFLFIILFIISIVPTHSTNRVKLGFKSQLPVSMSFHVDFN